MLSICQRGGLCNRLLTILSHALSERMKGRSVLVFWPASMAFPGTWDECFRPITGVIVLPIHPPFEYADVKEPSIDACVRMLTNGKYGSEDHWWGNGQKWAAILDELQPSNEVQGLLPKGDYDAVHIRRTDLSDMIAEHGWGEQVADKAFDEFIEQSTADFVWLATDDPAVQERMRNRHGSKIHCVDVMKYTDDYTYSDGKLRHTSGVWAAADLFACVGAKKFMGSRHSSFSHLIEMKRERQL